MGEIDNTLSSFVATLKAKERAETETATNNAIQNVINPKFAELDREHAKELAEINKERDDQIAVYHAECNKKITDLTTTTSERAKELELTFAESKKQFKESTLDGVNADVSMKYTKAIETINGLLPKKE